MPVDLHPRLFSDHGSDAALPGERRCDLALITLKRNIVEATFVEVKWRRGAVDLHELARDMVLQMEDSARAMQARFFDAERIDGALQRAYLANVLRFYLCRARRYGLFDQAAEASFLEHLLRLEKTGLDFRPAYEGYIVSLKSEPRKPFMEGDARITVLTARDFASTTDCVASALVPAQSGAATPAARAAPDSRVKVAGRPESPAATTAPTGPSDQVAAPTGLTASPDAGAFGPGNPALDVPLGVASEGPVDWAPSIKGSPHLFVVGIPGQGKSWTVMRILSALGAREVPALVLDFHGQFADPHSPFVRAANPVVLDAAQGLPFSPFECSLDGGAANWKATCYAIAEIFAYVAHLGDMQRDAVYTAVRDAYRARGFGDGAAEGPLDYPTLHDVLTRIEARERLRQISNVSARCRPLLEMELFRPGVESGGLLATIRKGLVIDLHNLYAETVQLAAGAFVLRKLYRDMFHWGPAEGLRLVLALDEAHRLARDTTLPKIMKEGRKFGIAVIVASQGLSDFHQDVLSNAGTKVIFRTNYPESRRIAWYIRARPGQDVAARIEQLPVGSAYVQTPEMTYGVVVRMYPLDAGV